MTMLKTPLKGMFNICQSITSKAEYPFGWDTFHVQFKKGCYSELSNQVLMLGSETNSQKQLGKSVIAN